MDNYTVYKHVSPSGKQYIGITKWDVEKRWSNGEGYKQCSYFYNAIQKYGWDNFEHIILYTNLSREKACEIEKNENIVGKTIGYVSHKTEKSNTDDISDLVDDIFGWLAVRIQFDRRN